MEVLDVWAEQKLVHLISDAHEWINEIPTVPTYYLESSETTAKGTGLG